MHWKIDLIWKYPSMTLKCNFDIFHKNLAMYSSPLNDKPEEQETKKHAAARSKTRKKKNVENKKHQHPRSTNTKIFLQKVVIA